MEKVFFRYNSPWFTRPLLFLLENKYSKVLNEDVHGRSQGPSRGTPRGPNDGTSGNLLRQITQDFIIRHVTRNLLGQESFLGTWALR